MIDKNDENPEGSSGIPTTGSAGTTVPSPHGAKDEQPGTGPVNEELEWARRHVKEVPPRPKRTRRVLRKTELKGTMRTREDARKFRKQILQDLKESEDYETVARFEKVLRSFIDTLIERQNAIEDSLLLQIAELGQRADEIEEQMSGKETVPEHDEVKG